MPTRRSAQATPRFVRTLLLFALLASVWTFHATSMRANMQASVTPVETTTPARVTDPRERRMTIAPDAPEFSQAIEERTELLTHTVNVQLVGDSAEGTVTVAEWNIALADHPLWVVFDTELYGRPAAVVSEKRIAQFIANEQPFTIPEARSCTVLSDWTDDYGVQRAQTSCIAQDGYTMNTQHFVQTIRAALEQGKTTVSYPLTFQPGVIHASADSSIGDMDMTLLSVGRSNFKGSGLGRIENVRKALTEHVNNVIIPAGATYSFNKTLGPAVTTGNGWYMAYTIFNGGDLIPAPGGGICQTSTTMYRAALRAGLPIVAQKNHSLYVTYYEQYGVGLDATIFPGQQDMQFVNDTGAPLLVQSYYDGDDAFVQIFGKDDGRTVALTGPYFSSTSPEGKNVRYNEILWQRTVTKVGEESTSEDIVARYKSIPKSLASRSTLLTEITRGETEMHAAAE